MTIAAQGSGSFSAFDSHQDESKKAQWRADKWMIVGTLLMGTGVLFLARHKSSLGGATIVSLYVQERYGIRAGKVQMVIDCVVVALALWVVPLERVLWSILAAVVMGIFLALSHRPGRYNGK